MAVKLVAWLCFFASSTTIPYCVQGNSQNFHEASNALDSTSLRFQPIPTGVKNSAILDEETAIARINLRAKLNRYKALVKQAHGLDEFKSSSQRSKRDVITVDDSFILPGVSNPRSRRNQQLPIPDGPYIIKNVSPVTPPAFNFIKTEEMVTVYMNGHAYLAVLEKNGEYRELAMYSLNYDFSLREVHRVLHPGATHINFVTIEKEHYFLVSMYNSTLSHKSGTTIYKFEAPGKPLVKVQIISASHTGTTLFWEGSAEEANDVFLAIVPEFTEMGYGSRYKVSIPCYRWQGGYFDYVFTIPASNPQAISHFNLFSTDYVAIANYQDETGNTAIFSEILKYNFKESNFVSFQRILTHGAKDIKYFSFGKGHLEEHFIAVANHCKRDEFGRCKHNIKSLIMKLAGDRFIPFQSIETYGALQFLPVKHDKTFFLALIELEGVRFFQYNGWKFVTTYQIKFGDSVIAPSYFSAAMSPLIVNYHPYFILTSMDDTVPRGIFRVDFDSKNDYDALNSEVEAWCLGALEQIRETNVSHLVEQYQVAPKVTDDQIVLHKQMHFMNEVQIKELTAQSMEYKGRTYDDSMMERMYQKYDVFKALDQDINLIFETLRRTVKTNVDEEVKADIRFTNLEFLNGATLVAKDAYVGKLNDHVMSEVLSKLVFLDQDRKFVNLNVGTIVAPGGIFTQHLNGHKIDDYALKSGRPNQLFTAKNTFLHDIYVNKGIVATGAIAHYNFQEGNYLLYNKNQTFNDDMVLSYSDVNEVWTRFYNGRNLDKFFTEGVPAVGNAVIHGQKRFKRISGFGLGTNSLVSDVNVTHLLLNTIVVNGRPTQYMKSCNIHNLKVDSVEFENKLINGKYDLERDFYHLNGKEYQIESLTLADPAFVKSLIVTQSLNNIAVDENGELDVVLKKSNRVQHICNKTMKEIHFGADVTSLDYFDGLDVNTWSNTHRITLPKDEMIGPIHINGVLTAKQGVANVEHMFLLNNHDVIQALKHAGSLLADEIPGTCNIIFESVKVLQNTMVEGHINQMLPSTWVLRNSPTPTVVSGVTEFENNVHLKKDSHTALLFPSTEPNELEVFQSFSHVIFNGIDQTLDGDWIFHQGFQVDNFNCPDVLLNGIKFQDLWFRDEKMQVVQVPTEVNGIIHVTDSLVVKNHMNTLLLDGVPFSTAVQDTLRTNGSSGPQVITGEKSMEKNAHLEIMNDLTVHGLTNGYNLNHLLATVLRKDIEKIEQVSHERVIIDHTLSVERLDYSGLMNGIPHDQWGRQWLLKSGSQVVQTPVVFLHGLSVPKVYVHNGIVNSIDVVKLSQDIQRVDQDGQLGRAHFHDVLDASPNVYIGEGGHVNGLDLKHDVLLRNSSQVQKWSGTKDFRNGWTIHGNLKLAHSFPYGFDYKNAARFVHSKVPSTREKLIVMGDVWSANEPMNSHKINGILWENILTHMWFTNRPATFAKKKVNFKSLVLEKGLVVIGEGVKVSGMDLTDLQRNYASKTKNQSWTGMLTFHNGVQSEFISADNVSVIHGLFQGVHMVPYSLSVMYHVQQTITHELRVNTLIVDALQMENGAKLNGILFPYGFMLLHTPQQVVTGVKTFSALHTGVLNFPRGMKINGMDMEKWSRHVALVVGNNGVRGDIIFDEAVFLDNVEVLGKVNGIKFDEYHVLTLSRNQTLNGNIVIGRPVIGRSIAEDIPAGASLIADRGIFVNGQYNGYELHKTFDKLVKKDDADTSPLVIRGKKVFASPITVNYIKIEKLYGDINITKAFEDLRSGVNIPQSLFINMEKKYSELTDYTRKIESVSTKMGTYLEYYKLLQTLYFPTTYIKCFTVYDAPIFSIYIRTSENIVSEIQWRHDSLTNKYQEVKMAKDDILNIQGDIAGIEELVSMTTHNIYLIVSVSSLNDLPVYLTLDEERAERKFELNKEPGFHSKAFILKATQQKTGGHGALKWVIHQTLYGDLMGGLTSFYIGVTPSAVLCATVVTHKEISSVANIICEGPDTVFHVKQRIELFYPTLVNSLYTGKETLLIIISETQDLPDSKEGVVNIWRATNLMDKFIKIDNIPMVNPVAMDTMHCPHHGSFLAIASTGIEGTRHSGVVYLYKYIPGTRSFIKVQTLKSARHPLQVKFQRLAISKEMILYVVRDDVVDNIHVYMYKGVSGWQLEHKFTSDYVIDLDTSHFYEYSHYEANLMVRGLSKVSVFSAQFYGAMNSEKNHSLLVNHRQQYTTRIVDHSH